MGDAEPSAAEWTPVDRLACERASGRILDVGCATARPGLWQARPDTEVVGVACPSGAPDSDRGRGGDARHIRLPELLPPLGTFDTFLLLSAEADLLGPVPRCRAVLSAFSSASRPHARLVATSAVTAGEKVPAGRGTTRVRERPGRHENPWSTASAFLPGLLLDATEGTPWTVENLLCDRSTGQPLHLVELRHGHRPRRGPTGS